MTKYHLCIVSETFSPDVNGVAISLQRLIRHLDSACFRVSVVRPAPREVYEPEQPELWCRGVRVPQYPDVQLGLPAASEQRTGRSQFDAMSCDPGALVHVRGPR